MIPTVNAHTTMVLAGLAGACDETILVCECSLCSQKSRAKFLGLEHCFLLGWFY